MRPAAGVEISQVCEHYHAPSARLEVHHKHYETFKREGFGDLEVLCPACHEKADRKREDDQQKEFEVRCEDTRYSNARETYLDKKYGGFKSADMDQEFDEWLQKKEEDRSYSGGSDSYG